MKISKLALDYAGKILIPKLWFDIKNSVEIAEATGKPGNEKKEFAFKRMQELGYSFVYGLFEFAVQLAWLWLNAKMGKEVIAFKGNKPL